MQRTLIVCALALILACPAAASEREEDTEQPRTGKGLWWTITALYGASLAFLVLEQQHTQPCDVGRVRA